MVKNLKDRVVRRFKIKTMNKHGKTSVWLVVGVIAMLLLLGVIAFGVMQTQVGDPETKRDTCSVDTVLTLTSIDALNGSTTTAPTIYARSTMPGETSSEYIGTITSGTTKLTPGADYELLISDSNHLDKTMKISNLGCGPSVKAVDVYYSNGGAFTIWNSDGDKLIDSATGASASNKNQSTIASTATLSFRVEGVNDQSLGDLVVVIEATNTTEVKDLIISGIAGITKTTVPKFYAVNAAGSVAEAYIIPEAATLDGASATGSITITAEAGKTVGGVGTSVYVTAYKAQDYKDVDNTFKHGIEDSNGNTKYLGTFDYDFYII